ncbi:MAG TPA: TonB-dependent receptor [Caulobacteraceae bacterium]|jgi:iron complex outermembrane receptor protein
MRTLFKVVLLSGAAWGASSTLALAAAPAPDPSVTVGEVVVTARRTSESLQKTPVSVTAISQKQLDAQGATDTTDLQGSVPNMNIVHGRGQADSTNIYIRGVGQPDALQTFDPAVGVYVDDVYYPRIVGSMFDLLNLKDIEVLRGPQGTLYGKNTIAGALKIDTQLPDSTFHSGFDLSLGNYDSVNIKGFVQGPVSDTLSLGLSALSETHDGYVKDTLNGRSYDTEDTQSVRGQAVWKPSNDFSLVLSADYTHEAPHLTAGQPTSTISDAFGIPLEVITNPPKWDWKTSLSNSLPNKEPLDAGGVSATATWNVSDAFTIKSITAFRHLQYDYFIDIDATPLQVGDVQVAVKDDTFSEELQFDYKSGAWNVVSGLYYLNEHIISNQDAYANDYIANPFPIFAASTFLRTIHDDLRTESYAAYANAIYAVNDNLHISAGVRITDESKKYAFTTSTFSDNPLFDGTYTPAFLQDPKTWVNVSPMVSIDYQVTPAAMIYARIAEGFQSGGFNGRSDSASTGLLPYGPETLWSYEAGFKTDWFEHKLRLNGDVFYNDYRNFQASVGTFQPGPGGINTAVDAVINAGGLSISGAELELTAAPTEHLRFDAEIGYLDAKYTRFNDTTYITASNPTGSRTWMTPAFSPKWTIRLGPSYSWDLAGGHLTLSDQAVYHSSMAIAIDNASPSMQRFPGMFQPAYWVDDAQLVWNSADDRYSLGLYAKNIGNQVYRTDAENFATVGGIMTDYYGDPRTYNITFRYRY